MRKLFYFWPILGLVLSACATEPSQKIDRKILHHVGTTPASSALHAPSQGVRMGPKPSARAIDVADIDAALETYFSAAGDGLILLPNRLDKSALNYSVESLHEIDRWLADIHKINTLQAGSGKVGELVAMDGRGDNSVIFAGLYLGEVIRANSSLGWQWQRFDRFLEKNPAFAEHYGRQPGFDTFVLVGPQGVTTPINTALKRVIHGKEESVHYIGQLLLNKVDLEKAVRGRDLMGLDKRDWQG